MKSKKGNKFKIIIIILILIIPSIFQIPKILATAPTVITTPQQLSDIRNDRSGSYILGKDIDLTYDTTNANGLFYNEGNGWKPIPAFEGILDGNGYKIKGLYCNNGSSAGLFLSINGGTVKNLGIVDCNISVKNQAQEAGGITSSLSGEINNCYVTGVINGRYAGGIAGEIDSYWGNGTISNCYNAATINGTLGAGGIIGTESNAVSDYKSSSITNCYNIGTINATNGASGGILGCTENGFLSINYTYNIGTINSNKYKGGILGSSENGCSINNSYFLDAGPMVIVGNQVVSTTISNSRKYGKEELKKQSSYANFDFSNVWQIQNNSYPTLKWESKLSSIPKINSITGNVTNWTNKNVTLTINATGNITNYSFDDGKTWQTTNTKTYSQNITGIKVRIKDSAGNIGLYGQTIDIDKIEKVAPTISSVTGNATNWTNQNIILTVNATDSQSGIASTNAYSFDNGQTWQTANTKTYTQNTNGIVIKVKDNAGNIETYSQTINIDKIDKTKPTISSVTGNATNWTNQNIILTVNAADSQSGIASTNAYSFDNGQTWQTANTKTYTQNTNGIAIKVKDNLGNIETYSQTIDIDKIDKIEPTIEITPNGADISKNKEITITVDDNGGSGLNNNNEYQYQLSTSNTEMPVGTWQNYTIGEKFKIGEELTGDYYIWVKSITDNAGNNTNYKVSNKFTFDNTPEELEISSEKYIIDEENYIKNIEPKTNLAELLSNITCNYEMKVYDKNDKEVTEETLIATGMKIKVKQEEYILVVKGDVNGSGTVDLNDAIKVLQHRAGGINPQLEGSYLKAAQLTIEGQVSLNDVIKIMRYKATNGETEL